MITTVPTRDSSFIDEYYISRSYLEYKPNFQISVTYSSEVNTETIFRTLIPLLKQYIQWSLQVYPKENSNKNSHTLKPIDQYKLSDVLKTKSSKDISFEDLLTSLIHHQFELSNDKKPLWGLILFDSKTLIFYADHLMGDGTSFLNFLLEFTKLLNEPVANQSYKYDGFNSVIYKYSESSVNQLCPTTDSIINYTWTWVSLIKISLLLFLPYFYDLLFKIIPKNRFQQLQSNDKFIVAEKEKPNALDYHLSILNIPKDKVKQLLKISRSHAVKLTSLLYVIGLSALLPITKDKDTLGDIPVNIRKLIDAEKANELCSSFSDKFGLFLGVVVIELPSLNKFKLHENSIEEYIDWNVVKYVQDTLSNGINTSNELLSLLRYINIHSFVEASIEKPRISAFEISNLGAVKQDSYDQFEIVNMVFNQPPGRGGSSFGCNVLGTDVGGINLSLTCTKALDDSLFQTYVNGFQHWIELVIEKYATT